MDMPGRGLRYLLLASSLIFLIGLSLIPRPGLGSRGGGGLLIITTFPSLAQDLELLVCDDDEVISLVPAGADPHEYQLRPSDLEVLREADLIVSTGHTPMEVEIRDMVDRGELGATLVEVPGVPGMRFLVNPSTGQPNYHMPIYDPVNYERFIAHLSTVLAHLRPERRVEYEENARRLRDCVEGLLGRAPKLDFTAVADLPVVQYAVSWLGIEITSFVLKEPGAPATPGDLMELEEALANHEVDLVIVCQPTVASASKELEALAKEHGLPILYVPSPMEPSPILDKLSVILDQALGLAGRTPGPGHRAPWGGILILLSSILVASVLAAVEVYGKD